MYSAAIFVWHLKGLNCNQCKMYSLVALNSNLNKLKQITLMCLSIGTPKDNKFSICPKWKIHYFQVSQNLDKVQPHYNVLEYWDT